MKTVERKQMNASTKTEMLAAVTVSDPRWAAVVARDPKADGKFFYPVKDVAESVPQNLVRSWLRGLLAIPLLIFPEARAAETMPSGLYEVTTEIAMPHLEENLRYTTTREKRCLSHQELSTAFPILNHESLKGCRLDNESRLENTVSYLLVCEGGHGTTGTALWDL
ncbi:MAG: hypothetical protein ACREUV_05960, partial [Burkholderiales bacterium]